MFLLERIHDMVPRYNNSFGHPLLTNLFVGILIELLLPPPMEIRKAFSPLSLLIVIDVRLSSINKRFYSLELIITSSLSLSFFAPQTRATKRL